jgi:hypothetical protein
MLAVTVVLAVGYLYWVVKPYMRSIKTEVRIDWCVHLPF